jgi:hypothetical protein
MYNSALSNDNAIRPETNLERLYANWQTDYLANLDESWPMRLFFSDGAAKSFIRHYISSYSAAQVAE